MQVFTSLQTDNHTSTPPLSFLQAGCPSCRPTNSVKALKAQHELSVQSYTSVMRVVAAGYDATAVDVASLESQRQPADAAQPPTLMTDDAARPAAATDAAAAEDDQLGVTVQRKLAAEVSETVTVTGTLCCLAGTCRPCWTGLRVNVGNFSNFMHVSTPV